MHYQPFPFYLLSVTQLTPHQLEPPKHIRIAYLGKILKDNKTLKEQNWEELEIFFKENNLNKGWPPNRGAIHTKEITLKSGEKIDRDGGYIDDETGKFIDRGTFAAKPDVPFEKRVP